MKVKRKRSGSIDDASLGFEPTQVSASPVGGTPPVAVPQLTHKPPEPKPVDNPFKKVLEEPVLKKTKTSPPTIPYNLKRFGNAKAWEELIAHIHGPEKHKPVLIHGPTGCGKTLGVQECLKLSGVNCTLLDGSAPEGPTELDTWISQVRDNSVLEGEGGVLFIDDVESFTDLCRGVIIKHVKKTNKGKSPLIITCTDFYSVSLKELTTLFKKFVIIRLYAPRPETVSRWLQSKGYNIPNLESILPDCKGDLRSCEISLKFHMQVKHYFEKQGKRTKFLGLGIDQKQNIFELANSLLTKKNNNWFDIFSSGRETSHVSHIRLLFENLPQLISEPSKILKKDPLVSHMKIMESFSNAGWDCLPELVHSVGMTCQYFIGCKQVSNKWSLPPDKSNIRKLDNKDLMRNVRDSYLERASFEDKKKALTSLCDQVYDSDHPNRPDLHIKTSEEMSAAFKRFNPMRLTVQKDNLWDIPSCLGGIKF